MRRQVGLGSQCAFDNRSIEIGQNQIGRFQLFIRHAARLDRHQSASPVHAAGVAEGVKDQSSANQFEVGLQYSGAEGFQAHRKSLREIGGAVEMQASRAEQYRTAEIRKETFSLEARLRKL